MDDEQYARLRDAMVQQQIAGRDVTHPQVLAALRAVPRHLFVPIPDRARSYEDYPLPIGHGQTISQPYIVGYMTQALNPAPEHRVLEIGTGSGYQTAVLARLVKEVYSIEIVPALGIRAQAALSALGVANVHLAIRDGYDGWPEAAPFDGIMLTAAPVAVPPPLLEQLAVSGALVAPVGPAGFGGQALIRMERTGTGFRTEELFGVRFVPLTGKASAWPRSS
jgi:protein-L-isoaspartate(D-aspartate) O-methyltransferase